MYVRFWNEAPLAINAPYNDLTFLRVLKKYPKPDIAKAASVAFQRHLWYLSEPLVSLAFFDPRVDDDTKKKMVANLKRPRKPDHPRRITVQGGIDDLSIEDMVTKRSLNIFNLLKDGGKEDSRVFLSSDPERWQYDDTFLELQRAAVNLKVVNDVAERGVKLATDFNNALTKDEEQKQFLLQAVAVHRRKLPKAKKSCLLTSK